ncbi:amidase signature enzyme [Laetiporus sulphureus 93-53]|uniref:amidase n=1 Tax=Laetiporus sulphureus 93-53 TaxID=1314785 RepID=A0A165EGL2_9APHY|nr:amidase signature enzyme [Laetiporus sulphureus 93-53]KZT07013.1 amidase signature enzyme [Laetiporus sulphureus 93-53]
MIRTRVAREIVHHIEQGEWTASQVLDAYIARSLIAQRMTHCLTEVMFEQARADALALDKEFAISKTLKGPLHGVPVSFKDLYNVKDIDSTMGYTSYADKPQAEDASPVEAIRAAGGIPFVKTNLTQGLMSYETVNPLWGRTVSPHDAHFSSGGSSGGEGALLAMDGSALGWGTDIGGSLRIPAAYCGIYAFTPSPGRISRAGITRLNRTWILGVPDVLGPIARSIDDLELACRVAFGQDMDINDYVHAPVPFKDTQLAEGKLRFGYYVDDHFVKASPACERAVLETVEALRREEHECVKITIPQRSTASKALELFVELTSADGFQTLAEPNGSDPLEPELYLILLAPKSFGWLRSLAAWATRQFLRDEIYAKIIMASRKKSVREYWRISAERDAYARLFYKEIWDKHGLDGIIAPVHALPRLPHHATQRIVPLSGATALYNIVQCPAGALPVTHVDAARDQLTAGWTDHLRKRTAEGRGSPFLEGFLYGKGGCYDVEKMAGLPVGIQIAGRKLEDEKVLAMMRIVDKALGPRGFGPGSWSGQRGSTG